MRRQTEVNVAIADNPYSLARHTSKYTRARPEVVITVARPDDRAVDFPLLSGPPSTLNPCTSRTNEVTLGRYYGSRAGKFMTFINCSTVTVGPAARLVA